MRKLFREVLEIDWSFCHRHPDGEEVATPKKRTDITGINIENRRGEINKRV